MKEQKNRFALLTVALGLWLIALPLTFAFKSPLMRCSDILAGVLCVGLGLLSLAPARIWSGWAVGVVGVWLQLAPLLLRAPDSLMYVNDTLVGALAIVFSFYLTKRQEASSEADVPYGWSYNPSGWTHRIPTVGLAVLCWFFSRYMAAFQLGYIDQIWDPFFPGGTMQVITSQISKDFPVSDAGLGALCYTVEALLGWQGNTRRFASMPWLVLAFGFLVIPVGIVSIILIVLQPVVVGAWCSWCLGAAACMLLMILLTAGELVATLQFLKQVGKKGGSRWKTLWAGGKPSTAFLATKPRGRRSSASALGITLPWNLVFSALIGIWLMLTPAVLGTKGALATQYFIFGPIVVAISIIACAEVFRSARFLNIAWGLILASGPWIVSHTCKICCVTTSVVAGLLIVGLAFRRGPVVERYGSWDRCIR